MPVALYLLLWIALPTVEAAAPPDRVERFIARMQGAWDGEAVRTPVGRLPYVIDLRPTGAHRVQGYAEPGAATHYWTFDGSAGRLRLRFLTTFRGNRTPVFLVARSWDGDAAVFEEQGSDRLRVRVEPGDTHATIRVTLRRRAHVEIHLRRAGSERRFSPTKGAEP